MMQSYLTTLILCLLSLSVQASELQRLFFSPAERQVLEQFRGVKISELTTSQTQALTPNESIVLKQIEIKLNGYVRRNNATPTLWINQKNTLDGTASLEEQGISPSINPSSPASVSISAGATELELKPGQKWLQSDNSQMELFERSVIENSMSSGKIYRLEHSETSQTK